MRYVPAFFVALFPCVLDPVQLQHLGLLRRNNADLVVLASESTTAIDDWVNVELRGRRLAGKLA